jgi:hypothetical protein
MPAWSEIAGRLRVLALAAPLLLLGAGCDGDRPPAAADAVPAKPPAVTPDAAAGADAPDTRELAPFVLAKINAHPSVGGTATLVEFRRKSVSMQRLGDKTRSAVVEFAGVVRFSADVSWSWQGPTRAGEPQPFEARAEYVDRGQGWQLVEPIGIFAL